MCAQACTCMENIHVHMCTHPCPPHLCVNELFLWRGQVERSQSFQPKKSIASSWIIEMFAISFFKKKKIQSLFDVFFSSTPFAFTCDTMIWRYKFSYIKSFHSFNDTNIAVFGYLFLLSSSSCICAHRHFSHIATVIFLPALS